MDNNQTIDIGRLRFEEEFDNVIFDVDVDIEKLILKVNNTTPVDHELIHHLNERRDITIKAINEIKNVNNELNVREKIISKMVIITKSTLKPRENFAVILALEI